MKKVLITGGAGFIGRHLTKRCTDLGWLVNIVDNMSSESALRLNEWHKSLKSTSGHVAFRQMDCREFFKYSTDVFDYVFHCAAVVGGRMTIEHKPIAVAEDLSLDSEMINWAVKTKQKKLILFSSSAAYPIEYQGQAEFSKLSEGMLDLSKNILGKPDLSYGLAKMCLEYLAQLAYEKHGLNSVVFRPFSGYGPFQHENYPFPNLLRLVRNWKEGPIEVWGTGEQVRDFIYIDDVVDAVFYFLDKVDNADVINLGTSVGTSFNELIRLMMKVVHPGKEFSINALSDKPVGVFYRVADTTKLNELGFNHKWTLEAGVRNSLEILGR